MLFIDGLYPYVLLIDRLHFSDSVFQISSADVSGQLLSVLLYLNFDSSFIVILIIYGGFLLLPNN